jgi:4-hydroxy-tetrahydrodipicolinate reductase
MDTIILGDGPLGRAIAAAFRERGIEATLLGRPTGPRHDASRLGTPGLTIEASRADAVLPNIETALAAGCRRFVIATTGWEADRATVEMALHDHAASAVSAPNLSIGAALFVRLVERATALFGSIADFEPYIVEWHRRTKADRPSGTALELARRIIAAHPGKTRPADPASGPRATDELEIAVVRAGASPGMHLVGFDAAGETIELRLTARDRSAYAAGALAAADWLVRRPRPSGIHPFDSVVDDLAGPPVLVASA